MAEDMIPKSCRKGDTKWKSGGGQAICVLISHIRERLGATSPPGKSTGRSSTASVAHQTPRTPRPQPNPGSIRF
ncbi:hypothetical protein BT69DRAFT_1276693 [Atractiella rhizophila]|nr:hypothetical protein BT69DRAFT_1276693 [Atractiella rhizophila]